VHAVRAILPKVPPPTENTSRRAVEPRHPRSALTGADRASSIGLVLGGVASVQLGAAIATKLFDDLGPTGTVLLRTGFAAVILMAIWRPGVPRARSRAARDAVLFGIALAAMNLSFYEALDRIPLGIAVTLEFTGPFAVAVAGSRRAGDLLWIALAAAGIVLLSPGVHGSLDGLGVALALVAGVFWAAYIYLAARVGREFSGGEGLALAMVLGTVLLLPVGIAGGGGALGSPGLLATGLAVAVLSSAIPYSLELEALRRLPKGTFGVLMSLEPAVAALVGLIVLGQDLSGSEVVAIALVVVASAGALGSARAPAPVEA
jgi:inner membrane transporter RhtA